MKNVLVTGGAGYIGSVVARYLEDKGYNPIYCDNLSTGNIWAVPDHFYREDIKNTPRIVEILQKHDIDGVLHFAAYSQVGESVSNPGKYYSNNVGGTLSLLNAMTEAGCSKLVFSSTAAVYGNPLHIPITEEHPLQPVNPYGKSKYFVEEMIRDYADTFNISAVIFRYFNAAGTYKERGEWHDPETHLIPNIYRACQNDKPFYLFGTDYETHDGTCIRDFINVEDLASAHYLGLQQLSQETGVEIFNLGTGKGNSVKEVVEEAKRFLPHPIKIKVKPPRSGDPPILVADYSRAKKLLGWTPQKNLTDSIRECFEYLGKRFAHLSSR